MGGGVTFDLDAAAVEGVEPFTFTFGGEVFAMPTVMGLAYEDTLAYLAAEREDQRLRLLLEPEQYERLMALAPTTGQVRALIRAWWEYQGTTEGESGASADSSPSTGRPSKPTSSATTGLASTSWAEAI
jgi:hypothetical protein